MNQPTIPAMRETILGALKLATSVASQLTLSVNTFSQNTWMQTTDRETDCWLLAQGANAPMSLVLPSRLWNEA
ncbi:MAG: hypothetical protein V4646_16745 [Pseudomonadota bacterium]